MPASPPLPVDTVASAAVTAAPMTCTVDTTAFCKMLLIVVQVVMHTLGHRCTNEQIKGL